MQAIGYIAYLALGLAQLFATVDGIQHWTGLPSFIAWIVAFIVAYIPLVGTIAGFIGAMEVWNWAWWQAALLFFGGFGFCVLIAVGQSVAERRA